MSGAFDAAYYARYYEKKATRVYDDAEIAALARGILGFATWWRVPLKTVLDVGAGAGRMRAAITAALPRVRYTSTEVSEYACRKYGHKKLDIGREKFAGAFDLVICQGVLPYLEDAACSRALAHLGAMTSGLLYLEAITARDLREVCDREKTDVKVHEREGAFYESRLEKSFIKVGAGLYAARKSGLVFYELEMAEHTPATAKKKRATTRASRLTK